MNPLSLLRTPRLAAQASHEVRGPLTVALLALEQMVARDEVDPSGALALEHQLGRARLALEDLSAASLGERAPDRLVPVPVEALLGRVAQEWLAVADLRVVADGFAGWVLADPTRVAQAVGNLVGNALEHGAPPVVLRGRASGPMARFEVHDAGPGLARSAALLSRRPRGARGHGLAIAGDIARRHGGRLLSAPSPDGAVLVFELPLRGGGAPVGGRS